MPYEHNLPEVLNPTGDIIVPLCIPHDADYTALLLGVLRQLEDVERYYRDVDYDDESAQIVAGNWRDRTITPLIDAIATGRGFGMKQTIYEKDFGANITISNGSASEVAHFTQLHTFERKNVRITLKNLACFAGDASSSVNLMATIVGATPASFHIPVHYNKQGGTQIPIDIMSLFEYETVGELEIQLLAFKSGANGSLGFRTLPFWLVEEWD